MTSNQKPSQGDARPKSGALAGFEHLPREIVFHIVQLACLPAHSSHSLQGAYNQSVRPLDKSTAVSLAQSCKLIRGLVTPIIFEHVVITHPSSLLDLLRALHAEPSLGKLIRSLHIGSKEPGYAPPNYTWPLATQMVQANNAVASRPSLALRTSLAKEDLPSWYAAGNGWPLEQCGRLDCNGTEIARTIRTALDVIDVEPFRVGYAASGNKIGLQAWAFRIHELQGCFDLFLAHMRIIEEMRGSSYPRLTLLGWGRMAPESVISHDNPLAISRIDVWRHITRRSSGVDAFDHPMTLAGIDLGDGGRLARGRLGVDTENFSSARYNQVSLNDDGTEAIEEEPTVRYEDGVAELLRGPAVPTTSRLYAMAAHVIIAAPNLLKLSLHGSLSNCLPANGNAWTKIRVLHLRQLASAKTTEPLYGHRLAAFDNLEKLLLHGMMIDENQAAQIAGDGGVLPHLRHFQWQPLETVSSERLLGILSRLQGNSNPRDECGREVDQHSGYDRFMEIHLSGRAREALIDIANPEQRIAWQAGLPLHDDCSPHNRIYLSRGHTLTWPSWFFSASSANVVRLDPRRCMVALMNSRSDLPDYTISQAGYPVGDGRDEDD